MESLIGIDPDHTADVKVGGAVFTVGVLEMAVWERLHHRWLEIYKDARRRSIALAESGEEENAVYLRMAKDGQYIQDSQLAYAEIARYCIRGHKNFLKKDNTEVPYAVSENERFNPVSHETMRWYKLIPNLMEAVFQVALKLHTLGENEKKALSGVTG